MSSIASLAASFALTKADSSSMCLNSNASNFLHLAVSSAAFAPSPCAMAAIMLSLSALR